MSSKNRTVIEIEGNALKVIQVVPSGKTFVLSHCSTVSITGLSDAEVARALVRLLPGQSPRFCGQVIVGVARQNFFLRYLRLPSHKEEEIGRMAAFQIPNQIPLAIDDAIFHHQTLEKTIDGYALVEITVIPMDVLNRIWHILKLAGIASRLVTVSSYGFLDWHARWISSHKTTADDAQCYVSLGSSSVEMCICYRDKVLFSRSVKMSGFLTTKESAREFAGQLEMTLESYRKEKFSAPVRRIIVITAVTIWDGFIKQLQETFDVPMDIMPITPSVKTVKNFVWPETTGGGEAIFTTAIGLGMADTASLPHFVPSQLVKEKTARLQKALVVRVIILFLVSLILLGAARGVGIVRKQRQLESLQEEIRKTGSQIGKLQNQLQAVQALDDTYERNIIFVEFAAELGHLWPKTSTLDSLKIANKNEIIMQGTSANASDIEDLQRGLIAGKFSNVVLEYVNKSKSSSGDVNYFKITCRWNPQGKT